MDSISTSSQVQMTLQIKLVGLVHTILAGSFEVGVHVLRFGVVDDSPRREEVTAAAACQP